MNSHPPKWANRFLLWYCNPDIIEEVQGDLYELYLDRLTRAGKFKADFIFTLEVIRFFRWSNLKRSEEFLKPGFFTILIALDLKIARRNASRNKLVFSIKMLVLSICLAFALLLSAFVIQEYNYDRHIADHDRIYRLAMGIESEGYMGDYGLTPVALAEELSEVIPEIESAGWASDEIVFNYRYVFSVGDRHYSDEKSLIVSEKFLEIMDIKFIHGDPDVFQRFGNIVITETTATKFFGSEDPLGKSIEFRGNLFDVAAIIADPPITSHLQYGILMSSEDFDICNCWDGLGATTYIKVKQGINIQQVELKIQQVLDEHADEMASASTFQPDTQLSLKPIIENVRHIHLNDRLDFDTSKKTNPTNLHILTLISILFLFVGYINFLNLTLAEITSSLSRIGVLTVFGGNKVDTIKVAFANVILSLFFIVPLTVVFILVGLHYGTFQMGIRIHEEVFYSYWFLLILFGCLVLFMLSPAMVKTITGNTKNVLDMIKGKIRSGFSGARVRGILVGTQLSVSIAMMALILIVVDQFKYLSESDKGFKDESTMVVRLPSGRFSQTRTMVESVQNLSGVEVAGVSSLFLDDLKWVELFEIEFESGSETVLVNYEYWGDQFSNVLGLRMIEGRDFDQIQKSDVRKGYIVNETAAQAFGWNEPMGKKINDGQVIGVVKDFHFSSLHDKIKPLIIHHGKRNSYNPEFLYIKIDPRYALEVIPEIEETYKEYFMDKVFQWDYLDARIANLYQEDRQVQVVINAGFWISILLSSLGILSVSFLMVLLRTREMSIRKVAGAGSLTLFWLHIRRFMDFTLIAFFLACPLIYYVSHLWLSNFDYRIDMSVSYFIVPCLVTVLIVLLTTAFHGLKISNVNPVKVLNGN